MLKACPNQKIPSIIMNINGRTAEASAISAPRVSETSLRAIDCTVCSMLGHNFEFPENPIEHYRERKRHSVRNLESIGVIERDTGSWQPEGHQRYQDMADITQG